MPETCDEFAEALASAEAAVAGREAELAQAQAEAAVLTAQLNALADSWSQGSHQGDWRDYGFQLEMAKIEATRELAAAEADRDGSDDTAAQLEQAWTDLEVALAEALDLEDRWLDVMAQITGDSDTDMGVPQSTLMDHATQLREQLDAALARVEECHRRIAELATRAQEDGAAAVAAAEAALAAAEEAREHWIDASGDLVDDLNLVPVDVRTRALEAAQHAEREARSRWEEHCTQDPEDEGVDTGDPGDDEGDAGEE